MSSIGDTESVKVWNRRVRFTVAVCEPLVPLTVKLNGFGVEVVRSQRVRVLVCPEKMVVGLKVQVTPDGQDNVTAPVKPLAADTDTIWVAPVEPMMTETV